MNITYWQKEPLKHCGTEVSFTELSEETQVNWVALGNWYLPKASL